MKGVFIYNVGCKLRLLDAKLFLEYFKKNNYEHVKTPNQADLIIIFTCAASNEALEVGIKNIKKLKKYKKAELIVAGCLPAINKEDLSEIFNGRTITTKQIDKKPEEIDKVFPENQIKFTTIKEKSEPLNNFDYLEHLGYKRIIRKLQKKSILNKYYFHLREHITKNLLSDKSLNSKIYSKDIPYPIRISWGCYGGCSYCAIKSAIGKFKSKPQKEIIDDFQKAVDQGYTNIFLTADSTGAYGKDINTTFQELLKKLIEIPDDYDISILNLHPVWINKYIDEFEKILESKKIKILDIPIQSGSKRILKLMNRFSDIKKIEKNFYRLKKAYPDLSLTTHVIVGFPTEEMEETTQTLKFINKAGFSTGVLFPFSCKSGTEAEKIEPKLSENEVIKRKKYSKKILKKLGYNVIPIGDNYNFYK